MLDRLLYRLASPLAREIIDSLRDEPKRWTLSAGLWRDDDESQSQRWVSSTATAFEWDGEFSDDVEWPDSLALRRAVNKWRKTHV